MFLCLKECLKKFCGEMADGHLKSYGKCESCGIVEPCADCPPHHGRRKPSGRGKKKQST